MTTTASNDKLQKMMETYPDSEFVLFVAAREHPILTWKDVPEQMGSSSFQESFTAEARPGEFYTLQLVVAAIGARLDVVEVRFNDLISDRQEAITAEAMTCFHTEGADYVGRPFHKQVSVAEGAVQSLWVGVMIPIQAADGIYTGEWTVSAGSEVKRIQLSLHVSGLPLEDGGDGELWKLSRLRHLNSQIALDDEVTAPFVPVSVEGQTVSMLGRKITLNDQGMPESIVSYFSPSVTEVLEHGREVLASPVKLAVFADGHELAWESRGCKFASYTDSRIEWNAASDNGRFEMNMAGALECDGMVHFRVTLKARTAGAVEDIRLEVPFPADVARYSMGMGHKGGTRPETIEWKWDASLNQDSIWIGDVNAGLRCLLKDRDYVKPFVNIYYRHRPLQIPASWGNEGKGGAKVHSAGEAVILHAYSGERVVEAGQELHFDFDLLLTPLKPIAIQEHWNRRFYHRPPETADVAAMQDEAAASGANVINIHHGTDLHPYINYPFFETEALAGFIGNAHEKDIRVNVYYTVREMTDRMKEMKALRSLGEELFPAPNGSAESILWQGDAAAGVRKHLGDDVIPAWKQTLITPKYAGEIDAAIISDGTSRMVNYYLEGLQWLIEHVGIDGIYIDDVAYDRTTIRRARKLLDRAKSNATIDFHTWNHMNDLAGYCNNLNMYMELLPYIDSLWIGEAFEYDQESADYWLIEISGIPFGLMGDMLQGGGNPWRGMVYGMTNRLGWHGQTPEFLWQLWDEFGMEQASMLGYWHRENPVRTGSEEVLATVYRKEDRLLIAIASWAKEKVNISLAVSWDQLGWDPNRAKLTIPAIPHLQVTDERAALTDLQVEPGKGKLIVLSKE
ncbi:glycoside hydrolase domain-containing protein [Paenibacillus sp. BC26]|uniref:glycoside hydrolase domain-containing protein n=1 Tax=Paenibacillus sp. BC26 TaxID=1881032 RepID=UPI0008EAF11D|nr:glycoside hydrolase domain-containing protein [Paenibacillus sp. BC26]SFS45882.1 hypothetical protein SAMN05428962_0194 [Paenibacillus sp. BC26]